MTPTLFADTNWLVAMYFRERDGDRSALVERFGRQHDYVWMISPIVWLEAKNVFAWCARQPNPPAWQAFLADIGPRFYLDTMNWFVLRDRTAEMCDRYSHKAPIGTFDAALVTSAVLAGATHFLSFDSAARALAAAEHLTVFPGLDDAENHLLATLRR